LTGGITHSKYVHVRWCIGGR